VYVLQNPKQVFLCRPHERAFLRLESHNRTDKVLGKFTRKNGPGNCSGAKSSITLVCSEARKADQEYEVRSVDTRALAQW